MVIPKLSMRGSPTAVVTAILSVAVAVCVLVKLIKDNEFQTIWAWIGFAIALALMLTALIRVRFGGSPDARIPTGAESRRAAAPCGTSAEPAARLRGSRTRSTTRKVARPTSAPRTAHRRQWLSGDSELFE